MSTFIAIYRMTDIARNLRLHEPSRGDPDADDGYLRGPRRLDQGGSELRQRHSGQTAIKELPVAVGWGACLPLASLRVER